jgi:3-deoxy-7-phosphoheptulonate synthase
VAGAPSDVAGSSEEWGPDSWRKYEALQQPNYPDETAVVAACSQIRAMPPLVFAGECRILQEQVAAAGRGEAFVVFGGDCAESFADFSANHIRDLYRLLLQMSVVMMFGGGLPVTKIGRIAGQFAKPRSADLETIDGVALPSYRGDIINGPDFTAEARVPDPFRLVQAYHQSAATLNLLRGFSTGGYGGLDRVADWNLGFMDRSDQGEQYLALAQRVDEAVQFMEACGVGARTGAGANLMKETDFYTAHECLLLDYESALTREDSTTGLWYNCSAHFVWVGERTRQLDGAHMEFMRGVANPIGVKVSDKMPPADLVTMLQNINPDNVPGRVSIITRMGAEKMREFLPAQIRAVEAAGMAVTWITDPMHGNTESCGSYKTRRYDNIRAEVEAFFDVHEECGTTPGGIHLEMTGEDVTECLGGGASVSEDDLATRYETNCDPRLNAEQALELSFYVAQRLRKRKGSKRSSLEDPEHKFGGKRASGKRRGP